MAVVPELAIDGGKLKTGFAEIASAAVKVGDAADQSPLAGSGSPSIGRARL